jgi:rubrerythrin
MPDVHKHIRVSKKIDFEDLDWDLAREIGLTTDETDTLTYFGDIEGQTIYYLRELLNTRAVRDPDTLAFITMWNYEEYFHSYAIARLLDVCGHGVGDDRVSDVRTNATFAARAEEFVQNQIARFLPKTFVALWMAWGASQELLTLRGYEHIGRKTKNPVLKTLVERIAKQERRHFAYYFNGARERLERSRFSQKFVRFIFEKTWTPVGGGVKSEEQVAEVVAALFGADELFDVMDGVDAKLAQLPGMEGFSVARDYAAKITGRNPKLLVAASSAA